MSFKLFFNLFCLQLHRLLVQHAGEQRLAVGRAIIIVIGLQFTCTVHSISKRQHRKSDCGERETELHVQRLADGGRVEQLGFGWKS